MLASVYSIYMSNIEDSVVAAQKEVVERFLPDGWTFTQYLHTPAPNESFNHAAALMACLATNKNPLTIFLDIDCVPISHKALPFLAEGAEKGFLTGAVQRANHLNNKSHLYVGPFCMAFLNAQYKKFGSPSFNETGRGDCAEELTYVWEEKKGEIQLLWPTDVYRPAWALTDFVKFGYGTTYENLFYHSFCIRQHEMQGQFTKKCKELLGSIPRKEKVIEKIVEKVIEKPAPKVEVKKQEQQDEPKKTVQANQEVKSRETKKETTTVKEANSSKAGVSA